MVASMIGTVMDYTLKDTDFIMSGKRIGRRSYQREIDPNMNEQ